MTANATPVQMLTSAALKAPGGAKQPPVNTAASIVRAFAAATPELRDELIAVLDPEARARVNAWLVENDRCGR